jgi:phi13 family phage major tail protein
MLCNRKNGGIKMAKIGVKNFRYAILTEAEDGTATYGEIKKPAKAIECKVSIENNTAELFADDTLAESDYTFKKGTVSAGFDDEDDKVMAEILGHTITEDGEMIRKDTDIAPYVGFGRILTKLVNGAYKYKVEFLSKVKFAEPSQEDTTKGESVEFKTGTLEGTVMKLASGEWSKTQTFTTYEEAVTYLENCFKPVTE